MKFWLAALLCLLPKLAFAADMTPESFVRFFYKTHLERVDANKDGAFSDKGLIEKFFSADIAERIQNSEDKPDFDPALDAQDSNIKSVTTSLISTAYQTAEVEVKFTNMGERKRLSYSLAREDGLWKIHDISSAQGDWRLQELFPSP